MQAAQFELHSQIETSHWWFTARREIVARLLRAVVPPSQHGGSPPVLVDVGCGTGANLAQLNGPYQAIGIDTSAEAIARARQRFPQVNFRQGYAPQDLGEWAQKADAWLLLDVLEHVPDDFRMLSELLSAAQPGAKFLITVPADMNLWTTHDESFGHYRRYSLPRFARLWGGLPVCPLLVSYYNTRLFPLIKAVRTLNRWRGTTGGAAGTDFQVPPAAVNELLHSWFAGESRHLLQVLSGQALPYRRGVSLVAVLQRGEGPIAPRKRPADVASDPFDPRPAAR